MELFSLNIDVEYDQATKEILDMINLAVRHEDGILSEITITKRGISMWYKDQEYADIDFVKLESLVE